MINGRVQCKDVACNVSKVACNVSNFIARRALTYNRSIRKNCVSAIGFTAKEQKNKLE